MSLLEIKNLYKQEKHQSIVDNINLTIKPSEKIGIVGSTGSGKTTLLKMIAGFIEPTKGSIIFNKKKVIGPFDKLIPGHQQIAYLSQHFELRSNYNVREVLEIANKLTEIEAANIYKICKIEHLFNQRTNELSGGENQRVALAIELSKAPLLLILDEPYSNLDTIHKTIIKAVVNNLIIQLKLTCIIVSHDTQDLLYWVNKIYVIQEGKIVQEGTPIELYQKPKTEYCAALFGNYTLIDVSKEPFNSYITNTTNLSNKVILRPEQCRIEIIGNKGLIGYVNEVHFYGSHYILKILVASQLIILTSQNGNYSIGEPIYISFEEHQLCYLD